LMKPHDWPLRYNVDRDKLAATARAQAGP